MWKICGVVVLLAASAACGDKKANEGSSEEPSPEREARDDSEPPAPPATPVCQAAHTRFGAHAECKETPLPDLTTSAGELIRVDNATDPSRRHVYALVEPSGEIEIGRAGRNAMDSILEDILGQIDPAKAPAELLARLYAELYVESAIVRCLPGTDDQLPATDGDDAPPCEPPAVSTEGEGIVLTMLLEHFPDPALLNRDDHHLWRTSVEVRDGGFHLLEGEGVAELDPDAPRPPSLPPLPAMTKPPAFVAEPVAAPEEVSEALCAAARENVSGIEGQRCKAYAYPSVELPTGAIYFLANDAGNHDLFAVRTPEGEIVVGWDLSGETDPTIPIVREYDPKSVPPETFLAARLLLAGEATKIRCLPGSNDSIPDVTCKPPTARKDGEDLVVEAIVEELPVPDSNGNVSDPAIRETTWTFNPRGGMHGSGFRLVDLRDGLRDGLRDDAE